MRNARAALAIGGALSLSLTPLAAQSPELVWEVGAIDGAPHETFEFIGDAVIAGDYAVVLAGSGVVRAYRLDGTPAGEMSRAGQGPGELQSATHLRAWADTIEVWDPMQQRSVAYSPTGEVLATLPPWQGAGVPAMTRPVWRRVGIGQVPQLVDAEPEDGFEIFVRFESDGARDTVAVLPRKSVRFRLQGNPFRFPWGSDSGAGPAGGVVVLGDTLLAILDGLAPAVRLFGVGPDGLAEAARWDLPGAPVSVTDEEAERLIALLRARLGDHPRFVDFVAPDVWPAWTAIEDGGDGTLWLRVGGPEHAPVLGEVERWVRWSLDGRRLDEVTLSGGEAALAFSGELILARRVDELDVHYLRLYRMSP